MENPRVKWEADLRPQIPQETGGIIPFKELSKQEKRTSGTRARWLTMPNVIGLALVPILATVVLLVAKDAKVAKAGPPIPQRNNADWVIGGDPIGVTRGVLEKTPLDIQTAADAKNQNDKVVRQGVVLNKTYNPVTGNYDGNSTLYVNDCDASGKCFAYRPAMELPGNNMRALLFETADVFYVGGEKFVRNWDTTLRKCTISTSSCGTELWSYGKSGPVINLQWIDNNKRYILGNNGTLMNVGQFIVDSSNPVTGSSRVQAVTNEVRTTNLPPASNPRIASVDTNAKTTRLVSPNFLAPGLSVYDVNYETATGSVNNYLESKLGGVAGITRYLDNSGEHYLVSTASQFIAGVDFTPAGIPVMNGYKIYTKNWMNQQVADIEPGSFGTDCLGTFVDTASNIHIFTAGGYRTLATTQKLGINIDVAGEFTKGNDPNSDPGAFPWRNLTPETSNSMGCQQGEMRSGIVNGQLTYEWPLRSNGGGSAFGGMVAVSANYLTVEYPNAGLDLTLPTPTPLPITRRAYLPNVTGYFSGAW